MSSYQGKKRQSLRLTNYDYATTGAYHVTVCTHQRQPLLIQPQLHTIVENEWFALPQRYPAVTLDAFIIMPDHIHCLLWINAEIQNAPTLFTIMKTYKSITTVAWIKYLKTTKRQKDAKIWQHYYHDQIIRDEPHLATVREYILNNPQKPH